MRVSFGRQAKLSANFVRSATRYRYRYNACCRHLVRFYRKSVEGSASSRGTFHAFIMFSWMVFSDFAVFCIRLACGCSRDLLQCSYCLLDTECILHLEFAAAASDKRIKVCSGLQCFTEIPCEGPYISSFAAGYSDYGLWQSQGRVVCYIYSAGSIAHCACRWQGCSDVRSRFELQQFQFAYIDLCHPYQTLRHSIELGTICGKCCR